jgi:hypothetical protein
MLRCDKAQQNTPKYMLTNPKINVAVPDIANMIISESFRTSSGLFPLMIATKSLTIDTPNKTDARNMLNT